MSSFHHHTHHDVIAHPSNVYPYLLQQDLQDLIGSSTDNEKLAMKCTYPGCTRIFWRSDLWTAHQKRHNAKGPLKRFGPGRSLSTTQGQYLFFNQLEAH
jgi:hypothetical protein